MTSFSNQHQSSSVHNYLLRHLNQVVLQGSRWLTDTMRSCPNQPWQQTILLTRYISPLSIILYFLAARALSAYRKPLAFEIYDDQSLRPRLVVWLLIVLITTYVSDAEPRLNTILCCSPAGVEWSLSVSVLISLFSCFDFTG